MYNYYQGFACCNLKWHFPLIYLPFKLIKHVVCLTYNTLIVHAHVCSTLQVVDTDCLQSDRFITKCELTSTSAVHMFYEVSMTMYFVMNWLITVAVVSAEDITINSTKSTTYLLTLNYIKLLSLFWYKNSFLVNVRKNFSQQTGREKNC